MWQLLKPLSPKEITQVFLNVKENISMFRNAPRLLSNLSFVTSWGLLFNDLQY